MTRHSTCQIENSNWVILFAPVLINLVCCVGLLGFHVHAQANNEVKAHHCCHWDEMWNRVSSGPSSLSNTDKALFAAIILLGMELLNYLSGNLGRE